VDFFLYVIDFYSTAALLAMQSILLATAIPPVRPSITRWYPIQTNEDRIFSSLVWIFSSLSLLGIYTAVQYVLSSFTARVPTSPGIFTGKFTGPRKSWKMTLVLESPGNLLASSWKVLEFARQ